MDKKILHLKDTSDIGVELMEDQAKPSEKKSSSHKKAFLLISLLFFLALSSFLIYDAKSEISSSPNTFKALDKNTPRRCIVFGYGGVAMTALPLLNKALKISEFIIYDKRTVSREEFDIIKDLKYTFINKQIEEDNATEKILAIIKDYDIVLNLMECFPTIKLLKAIQQKKGIVYADCSIEDTEGPEKLDNEYLVYQQFFDWRKSIKPTFSGSIDAGANPGLVTHFAIMGLYSMAKSAIQRKVKDHEIIKKLLDKKDIKGLVKQLQVKTVHISENEKIEPSDPKKFDGFMTNSWSVNGILVEYIVNKPEIAVGDEDEEEMKKYGTILPESKFPKYMVMKDRVFLKTVSPHGEFVGQLVVHPEMKEIPRVFSSEDHLITCGFVYKPSRLPRKIMFTNKDVLKLPKKLMTEVTGGELTGEEMMGATLISKRDDIPIRWYGSILTCEGSRELKCKTNPSTMQVAAGLISHLIVAMENPEMGICEPHEFDSERIMQIARPYLGSVIDRDLPYKLSHLFKDQLAEEKDMNTDF